MHDLRAAAVVQLLFDGTGCNRDIDKPKQKLSNIARLFLGHVADERPLIVPLYYPGVGTPLDASEPDWWEKVRDSEMLGGGVGLGSDVRLNKAEKEFVESLKYNHKVNRIDIAVFGFSRGAGARVREPLVPFSSSDTAL